MGLMLSSQRLTSRRQKPSTLNLFYPIIWESDGEQTDSLFTAG